MLVNKYVADYKGNAMRHTASGGIVHYLLQDHLKSSSAIASQAGVVAATDRNYYFPFGGNRGGAFNTVTTKRFTGQYHESTLPGGEGLSYYGSRWYDAKLGRFLSADTIVPGAGNPQAFNRYSYVLNRPTGMVDPTGHEPIGCYNSVNGQCTNQGGKPVASGGGGLSIPTYSNHGGCTVCHIQRDSGMNRWLTPSEMDWAVNAMNQRNAEMYHNLGMVTLQGVYVFVTFGASGGFTPRGFEQVGQTFEESPIDENVAALLAKTPEPYLELPSSSGSAIWFKMGVNRAGTTFYGPDRVVFTDAVDVVQAMEEYGPGIIIDGAHGGSKGEVLLHPSFFETTSAQFSNPNFPFYGRVSVLNISELSNREIQSLGGTGQNAYVNWCFGGYCGSIAPLLTSPD